VNAPVPATQHNETRNDVELIAAINGGDHSAFEVLYFRHRDWVVNLACRFTRDQDLALDVMQETFLYFLRKFPGFQLTANLKTFLYPAVRNLSIAAREKAKRCQATAAELFEIEQTAAPAAANSLHDLNQVVSHLPDEQRETLLLRFVDGLSLAEISEAMNTPGNG
jgi:RNA polymerase sigma-70 factor (ECF subfamily)